MITLKKKKIEKQKNDKKRRERERERPGRRRRWGWRKRKRTGHRRRSRRRERSERAFSGGRRWIRRKPPDLPIEIYLSIRLPSFCTRMWTLPSLINQSNNSIFQRERDRLCVSVYVSDGFACTKTLGLVFI